MRTETEVRTELESARAAYRAAANTETVPELADRTERLRELGEELLTVMRGDAVPCPTCGDLPHVHIKTPEHENRGQLIPAVYEVGCLNCKAVAERVQDRPAVARMVYAATRAPSAALAVAAWNRGERFSKFADITRA